MAWIQMIWGHVPSHHASDEQMESPGELGTAQCRSRPQHIPQNHYVSSTKLHEGDGMFLGPKTSQFVMVTPAPHCPNSIKDSTPK